jgi:ribonuclease E
MPVPDQAQAEGGTSGKAAATADNMPQQPTADGADIRENRPRGDRPPRERRPRGERPPRINDGEPARSNADGNQQQQPLEGFSARPVPPTEIAADPVVAAVAAGASTSGAKQATGLPKVESYTLPLQDLAQMAQSCGLEWINSDAEKIRVAQQSIAAQPKPIHVPRERPAPLVIDEGPLVLVETRRDLRNLSLPFEQPANQA